MQSIMSESLSLIDKSIIASQKPINHVNPGDESTESLSSADNSSFRRIEFHIAKKSFTNGGDDGSFRIETLNPTTTSLKNTHGEQLRVGSQSVGGGYSGSKRDASELENGLDQELSFKITFRRIGAGLENLGNTCFLNSVLQCLTYTEPLAAYLQSGKHQVTCRKSGFCALCAIQKHVSRALQLSGRSLAPKDLVSNLRCISRTFRNSRQEDAHEYMVNLLESMHKCCLPNGIPVESQSAYDKSLVHKIFGGQLRSQVKCMQCNYCSNKFDPFLDLSLEILNADSLYKAFANFTAKEQLDGGSKQYQCQQCKQKVKALKQLTVYKAPNVLTVHLKRFGCFISGQKIVKKVHFGPTLDLKPFVTGPYDGDLKYTLYGVLVHAGWSTHSGHYYCFVRTSSGMWYALDDNQVFQVSEKRVFEQKAYMLFYFKDRKNSPSKNSNDHQREKIVMNAGVPNGPGASKEAQMKTGPSNRSLNAQTSLKSTAEKENMVMNGTHNGPDPPREAHMNTNLSNGSLNAHMSLATTVGTEKSLLSSVTPIETQTNPILSLNGHKSLVSVTTLNLTGAPKDAQMKTGLNDGSSTVQKSLAAVGIEGNGSGPITPKETQTNSNLSNGSLISQKSSPIAGTLITGCSNASQSENTQTKEISVPISISDPIKTEDHKKDLCITTGSVMEKNAVMAKPRKKVKKFLKCNLITMKFSSNVLMGASLNQRKKKKHKRNKRAKNHAQENLVSEGSSLLVKVEAHETVKPVVDNVFKERMNEDGAVLATSDLNTESQLNPKESNQLENFKRSLSQKDLLHMLTVGVDDRTIPRWDEDESAPSQTFTERRHDLTIGNIGDEWDQEYDRGKRKKVRISKTEFDGKNSFQDIANARLKSLDDEKNLSKTPLMMTKRKNEHVKKSGAGNGPYRI